MDRTQYTQHHIILRLHSVLPRNESWTISKYGTKKELPQERHGERHQYGGTTPEQHTAAAAAATTRRSLSVGPDCALFGPVHGRQDGAERVPADGGHRGAIPAANKPMGVSRPWES